MTVQWQSWLRHTRSVAPTIEELVQEERRRAIIQGRAKVLDQEWEQVQQFAYFTKIHILLTFFSAQIVFGKT